MLRYQSNLPRLPVPKVQETIAKYLNSVKAVVSEEQYKRTEQAAKDFISSGAADKLQARLVARAEDPKVLNWMDDWWLDAAYLGYRDPVVVFVSYFYLYKDDKLRKSPAQRAAAITTAALAFRDQVVGYVSCLCVLPKGGNLQCACVYIFVIDFCAQKYPRTRVRQRRASVYGPLQVHVQQLPYPGETLRRQCRLRPCPEHTHHRYPQEQVLRR